MGVHLLWVVDVEPAIALLFAWSSAIRLIDGLDVAMEAHMKRLVAFPVPESFDLIKRLAVVPSTEPALVNLVRAVRSSAAYAEADRREVDPPVEVQVATWSPGGTLDWWVKERREWFGRVRGKDAHQRWVKAADVRPARGK